MTTVSRGAMLRREIEPEAELDQARAIAPLVDELWIVEDLPYAGGIAQVGPILAATDDVVVGHGIAPAPFRHPAALAMEWATLARMFPGRVQGGIGHGVPGWMAQLGSRPASPLTLLTETIATVRQLLAGNTTATDGRYVTADDITLEFPPTVPPPVSAGVVGPKSLALSARVADGTILPEGRGPGDVARLRALVEADPGPRDPARVGPRHRLTVFTGYHCGDVELLAPRPEHLSSGWVAVGPTSEAVADKLRSLVDAGADAVILVPLPDDRREQLEQLDRAATEIWPLV